MVKRVKHEEIEKSKSEEVRYRVQMKYPYLELISGGVVDDGDCKLMASYKWCLPAEEHKPMIFG